MRLSAVAAVLRFCVGGSLSTLGPSVASGCVEVLRGGEALPCWGRPLLWAWMQAASLRQVYDYSQDQPSFSLKKMPVACQTFGCPTTTPPCSAFHYLKQPTCTTTMRLLFTLHPATTTTTLSSNCRLNYNYSWGTSLQDSLSTSPETTFPTWCRYNRTTTSQLQHCHRPSTRWTTTWPSSPTTTASGTTIFGTTTCHYYYLNCSTTSTTEINSTTTNTRQSLQFSARVSSTTGLHYSPWQTSHNTTRHYYTTSKTTTNTCHVPRSTMSDYEEHQTTWKPFSQRTTLRPWTVDYRRSKTTALRTGDYILEHMLYHNKCLPHYFRPAHYIELEPEQRELLSAGYYFCHYSRIDEQQ